MVQPQKQECMVEDLLVVLQLRTSVQVVAAVLKPQVELVVLAILALLDRAARDYIVQMAMPVPVAVAGMAAEVLTPMVLAMMTVAAEEALAIF